MRIEWPTLGLIALCYCVWVGALFVPVWAAVPVLAMAIALQASLQHEVLHGHPMGQRRLGEPLIYTSLNLAVPYTRFRDTHLAHHRDATLTDPYEDPESNYRDPAHWAQMGAPMRCALAWNNTLLGRMVLGPLIGQVAFLAAEGRLIRGGDGAVSRAWAAHLVTGTVVLAIVAATPLPLWAYLLACYAGLSLLKIRTFLEHQAHIHAGARSVIIEDRGVLAFLFLNNNLHLVHHMHPAEPWYRLPAIYWADRARYLRRNGGYRYDSYAQVLHRHLLCAKDPVPHPHYRQK